MDMKRASKAITVVLALCLLLCSCTTKAEKLRLEEENRVNTVTEKVSAANLAIVPVIDQDPDTVYVYGWEAVKLAEDRYLAGYAYDTENSLKDDGYSMYAWEYSFDKGSLTVLEAEDEDLYKEHGITLYKAPEGITVSAGYYNDAAAVIKDTRLLRYALGTFSKVFGVQPYLCTEGPEADRAAEDAALKRYAERFTKDGNLDGMHLLIELIKKADGTLDAACVMGEEAKALLGEKAESFFKSRFSALDHSSDTFTNDVCTAFYSAIIELYEFKEAESASGAENDAPEKLTLEDSLGQTSADNLPVFSFAADGSFTANLNLYQGMYEISGTYRAAKDIYKNTVLVCTVTAEGNAFAGQVLHFTKLTGTGSWLYTGSDMGMLWNRCLMK